MAMNKKTPEYRSWYHMHIRCSRAGATGYEYYGARGIRVCDSWGSFENFLRDMGERPSPLHSIDRIDTNGHYDPTNCRWATAVEQARNKRSNRLITFNGETLPISAWAERLGIRTDTLWRRLACGWSIERALGRPVGLFRAPCTVCGAPAKGLGYCSRHYQQVRKHGTVILP